MVWSDSGDTSDFSEYSCIGFDNVRDYKNDTKKYECPQSGCPLVFSRPSRLAAHLCVHTGEKPFPCQWNGCSKGYTNRSHLSRHIRSVHEKVIKMGNHKCKQCDEEFTTTQNLKKHITRRHKSTYPYYCDVCQTGYKKKNILAQHMFYHTGCNPFKCHLCNKSFSEIIEFNKHKRNHKTFRCFCNEVFTRWSDMVKHKKLAHVQSEFICDTCQKAFKTRIEIVKHIRSHTAYKIIYQCTYDGCPKFYSSKYNLSFHIKSYHENLTFNCTVEGCNAKLSTKAKLQFHVLKHSNKNVAIKKNKQPRVRNKRKDVGTFKRSTAVKLAGINLSALEEKKLVDKEKSSTAVQQRLPTISQQTEKGNDDVNLESKVLIINKILSD